MRTTAIHNLIIPRPRLSLSLSPSPSVLTRQSLSLACAITHTHNHNNMFSLRTTRACVLFFVQIFPSLFSTIAVFWSLKERRERERERAIERERETRRRRRKEICVQITQIFYEWTHRGEKGKNSLFAHIHTRRFPFFFSLSPLFLFMPAISFFDCFFYLSSYSRNLFRENLSRLQAYRYQ